MWVVPNLLLLVMNDGRLKDHFYEIHIEKRLIYTDDSCHELTVFESPYLHK